MPLASSVARKTIKGLSSHIGWRGSRGGEGNGKDSLSRDITGKVLASLVVEAEVKVEGKVEVEGEVEGEVGAEAEVAVDLVGAGRGSVVLVLVAVGLVGAGVICRDKK